MKNKIYKIFIILSAAGYITVGCDKDNIKDYRHHIEGQYKCNLVIEENRYSYYIHDTTSISITTIKIQSYLDSFLLISDPLLYSGRPDTVKVEYASSDRTYNIYPIRNGFDAGYYNFISGSIQNLPNYTNMIHVRPPLGPAYATYYYCGIQKITL